MLKFDAALTFQLANSRHFVASVNHDTDSILTSTRSSASSMYIGLHIDGMPRTVSRSNLNDNLNVLNVKATTGHIGGHHDLVLASPKRGHDPFALRLRHAT